MPESWELAADGAGMAEGRVFTLRLADTLPERLLSMAD